jgi:hypothetical protein
MQDWPGHGAREPVQGVVRGFVRIVAFGSVTLVVVLLAFCGWFFLYSGDLPQLNNAAMYAPEVPGIASGHCSERSVLVVPYSSIGKSLREAITAAESASGTAPMRIQIARTLLCGEHSRILERALKELRLANQLRLHFNSEQLLTIYANTIHLGSGIEGIESASQQYFAKSANQLSLAESAMIAGMIKSPTIYSPHSHPDRALMRRNQVIDEMRSRGAVTTDEAAKAKSEELSTAK